MAKFKIAHIREQSVDIIIVPLESSFGNKGQSEQDSIRDALQYGANSAGLAGIVVPVWQSNGRMNFIAPQNWHPFFRSIDWNFVMININRELTISD